MYIIKCMRIKESNLLSECQKTLELLHVLKLQECPVLSKASEKQY